MTAPSTFPDGVDPRIDLYIDGLLTGEDLTAFERELRESAGLRAELKAQERVDADLREMFEYDAMRAGDPLASSPVVVGRIEPAPDGSVTVVRPERPQSRGRFRWYAVAAVLLLGVGIWATYINLTTPTFEKFLSPAEVYAMVDQPEFVCKDDREFAAAIEKRLGQPLVLAAAPGIHAIGWAYGDDYHGKIVGSKTMVLINKVHDQKVLVFMDRLRDDRTLELPPGMGSDLNIFRREVGKLVLYEVTPLDKPEVIDRLNPPAQGQR
jgi:hypothetical protein